MDTIFGNIYSFQIPTTKRSRPLQVIAAGPSRSGTESLRNALLILGYPKVYHGWETFLPENRNDMALHSRLLHKTYQSGDQTGNVRLTAEDFDTIFANYDAITDHDGAMFIADLVDAYPDAKVVMNYRKDLDKWHTSVVNTFGVMGSSWWVWFISHFNFELYWARRYVWDEASPTYFRGNVAENGKWVHREHMALVRGLVPADRLLEWTVEDGWEPLCNFLDKEIPKEEFPKGNTPGHFAKTIGRGQAQNMQKARRNLLFTLVVLTAVGFAGYRRAIGKW
jgi:hypothetical protein